MLDYRAYFQRVRDRLVAAVATTAGDGEQTVPEPVPQCDLCRWWPHCDRRRRDDDHLSLVAGISSLQRRELADFDASSLTDLARLPLPLPRKPRRGSPEGYERVREQARVQLEGRERGGPVFELLPRDPDRGLARLPAPSPGDVFFDIEGDPFAGVAGREYLLGHVVTDAGDATYAARWAVDDAAERKSFEDFIDFVTARQAQHPDMHVYHFAPYEPAALKRLMGRYATREEEVDRLLRGGVLVDLHAIVRQSLRASVERYSLKELEVFHGFEREIDLREASKALRSFELTLELDDRASPSDDIRAVIEAYNRDDCVSTLRLRDWLEGLRAERIAAGEEIARPEPDDGAASEELNEQQRQIQALMQRLLDGVPVERDLRTDELQATWLLAHLLDWHRREMKPVFWESFRLRDLDAEELLDERKAISGLRFLERDGGTRLCPIDRYSFPAQDSDVRPKDELRMRGEKVGTVDAIDTRARTLDIKKTKKTADEHFEAVYASKVIDPKDKPGALLQLGTWVAEHGIDAPGPHRAARDLLLGRGPRLDPRAVAGVNLRSEDEGFLDAACRLVRSLDHGTLAIQGPPGTGKSHNAARMICALVRDGRKVGITANSHTVIRNLLGKVIEAANEEGLTIGCAHKIESGAEPDLHGPIHDVTSNKDARDAIVSAQTHVLGGTAWLWARAEMTTSVDVLFIDEAGQMSLADVLASARGAHCLVLLGDPQQLDQPLQGSHPEGADASALRHLLGDEATIADHRGLFLGETWRLHPAICAFTSELFYDHRLHALQRLHGQCLVGDGPFAGAGLWFDPVEHTGNQISSVEEVERVAVIHAELTSGRYRFVDRDGNSRPLTSADILIVAPYNAQVGAIADRIEGANVGTVDRFQGQEAPVVIYSMATSSPEDAPRGMAFLYSLNRLNVATSRAQCVCVLMATPRLLEPECRTPSQMRLANAFCRYVDLAREVQGLVK